MADPNNGYGIQTFSKFKVVYLDYNVKKNRKISNYSLVLFENVIEHDKPLQKTFFMRMRTFEVFLK